MHELVFAQTAVIMTDDFRDLPQQDPSRSSEITSGFGFGLASQMLIYGRNLTLIQDTAIHQAPAMYQQFSTVHSQLLVIRSSRSQDGMQTSKSESEGVGVTIDEERLPYISSSVSCFVNTNGPQRLASDS